MRLEKVTLSYNNSAFEDWSSIHSGSTLIDLFCNAEFCWGTRVVSKSENYDIHIGKTYGTRGITVQDMLNNGADVGTVYCVSVQDFNKMNTMDRVMLLTNYIVMICDYAEGGFSFHEMMLAHNQDLRVFSKGEPIRCCFVSTSGQENYNFIRGVRNTINIPYFMLLTSWECHRTGAVPDPQQFMKPQKSALIPVHKPRMHRIKMLAELDAQNLLHNCDWSLTVNEQGGDQLGDFQHTPNVNLSRFDFLTTDPTCKSFYEKYKHLLPKTLVDNDITKFNECIPLPVQLAGKYQWYVSCETYTHMQFVTEKTYKAFMCGLPVLMIADANTAKQFSNSTGFLLPYADRYDEFGIGNDDIGRYQAVAEIIKENPAVHKDMIMNNYDLINNINWQVVLVVERLIKLNEYYYNI